MYYARITPKLPLSSLVYIQQQVKSIKKNTTSQGNQRLDYFSQSYHIQDWGTAMAKSVDHPLVSNRVLVRLCPARYTLDKEHPYLHLNN